MPIDDSTLSVAPSPTTNPSSGAPGRKTSAKRWPSVVLILACLTVASAVFVVHSFSGPDMPPVLPAQEDGIHLSETGLNADLFSNWPKDRKPEFVLFITAEMNGYLQKCGCSDPQKGGLERRWNLIQWLKTERGFEILPLDLGDVTTPLRQNPDPHVPTVHEQVVLKYSTTMRTLKNMGYKAMGIGLEEFSLPLEKAIGAYSMQPKNEYPRLLAANITGSKDPGQAFLSRDLIFPNSEGTGSAIRDWEVFPVGGMNVGVMGLVGDPIVKHVNGEPIIDANGKPVLDSNKNPMQGIKIDPSMRFSPDYGKAKAGPNSAEVVLEGLTAMSKLRKKPDLNVMLFQGPEDFARKLAGIFAAKPTHFDVVVCRTQESEPPGRANQNVMIGNGTLLVEVGHKGQQAAVVGVFKKKDGGIELHYQRIVLTEEFDTPPGKEKQNLALVELEEYAKTLKNNPKDYLSKYKRGPHPLQLANPGVKYEYVGSQVCQKCHVAEGNIHAATKHAVAFNSLVVARKPSSREFDGECIVCHTVGFNYNTGYMDGKNAVAANALLKNNGCENCHGPGSNHAATAPELGKPFADEQGQRFAWEMAPWKIKGQDHLPTVKKLLDNTPLTAGESSILFKADQICQKCHTTETDPHFRFEQSWPKIAHGNKQQPVLPPMPVKNEITPPAPKDGERLPLPNGGGANLTPPKNGNAKD